MSIPYSPFTQAILDYYDTTTKDKPWELGKDVYHIWIFEIVMQQTQMAQGVSYYHRITTEMPTVAHLASAPIETLYSLWQGLGYYSRARNLHQAAKVIMEKLNGELPKSYEQWLKLPGVGPYTAAAIASFGYHEAVAVLDGNVYRVLSRYFGEYETMHNYKGKKLYSQLAQSQLAINHSAQYNQGIMSLGANICKKTNPSCIKCPLNNDCKAYKSDLINILPPPKPKIKLKNRYIYCIFLHTKSEIVLYNRNTNDIWQGLYEGLCTESKKKPNQWWSELSTRYHLPITIKWPKKWKIQKLTHIKVHFKIAYLSLDQIPIELSNQSVLLSEIERYAMPRILAYELQQYLSKK